MQLPNPEEVMLKGKAHHKETKFKKNISVCVRDNYSFTYLVLAWIIFTTLDNLRR
jgi:hypothetical protein